MSYTMAKINARLIHKGVKSINDIAKKDQQIVKDAYFELFGERLGA